MPLVSGRELWKHMASKQLSLPHFDVGGGNLDMIWAVCEALADSSAAAFLASTPASIKAYLGFDVFIRNLRNATDHFNVYVAAHLDHATHLADIEKSLKAGFTSVMFDGSCLTLEKNIEQTRFVVDAAHRIGVSVEGELGSIGGKEDEVEIAAHQSLTLVEAVKFISETGIDYFAPGIGTQHGFYKHQPTIQWDLAANLGSNLDLPLVLHGSTGLAKEDCRKLIALGFKKINYATGVRCAFREGVLRTIEKEGALTRPQTYLSSGRRQVYAFVTEVLQNFKKS